MHPVETLASPKTSQSIAPVVEVYPNAITVSPWKRLLNGGALGDLVAVAWATLLKRTYSVDAMICPRMRQSLAIDGRVVDDPATARNIIDDLGMTVHPKPSARARGPDHYE